MSQPLGGAVAARPMVVANWKMNVPPIEWLPYIIKLKEDMPKKEATIVVCPPTVYLSEMSHNTINTDIRLGAQNVSQYHDGSFTGEVSVNMLSNIVEFVIVGHSERRTIFGESNEVIAKKLKLVGEAGLNPILCVGEPLEAKTKNVQTTYLRNQLYESLDNFTFWENLIVACSPCNSKKGNRTPQEARMKLMKQPRSCLLYTSPSPRDGLLSRMPSSA